MIMKISPALLIVLALRTASVSLGVSSMVYHLDFGMGPVADGYTQVSPNTVYREDLGYGFLDPNGLVAFSDKGDDPKQDGISSSKPFYFTLDEPEGNYRVTVTLGHPEQASNTTIKAELRRMMLNQIRTEPGHWVRQTFVVNVRQPQFPGGEVRLKERERTQEAWAWDRQLTLEINGTHPCLCALDIVPAPNLPTVFVIGDSTVCDQSRAPWNSWGQMLTQFFQPTVAIANHAESGETIQGSLGAHRFDKIYSLMRPGDYLLLQFGHNDMKDHRPHASDTYKANLKAIVAKVRQLGGIPVLITSMERKAGIDHDTLEDYPEKVREVATEDHVALIDLNKQSKILYRALGDHLDQAFQDGTHHNNYGSTLFAQCVVQGISDNHLTLADHIRPDFTGFDPAHPDPIESFHVDVSPLVSHVKPLGD